MLKRRMLALVEFLEDVQREKGKPEEILGALGLKRIDTVSLGIVSSPAPVGGLKAS